MKASPDKSDDTPAPPEKSTVILLLKDIGDVTWRLFVPFIGLTLLGWYVDTLLASKPWGVIGGMVVGIAVAALLIRNVYKKL